MMRSSLLAVLLLASFAEAADWTVDISTHIPHACGTIDPGFYGSVCDSRSIVTLSHRGSFQEEYNDSSDSRELAQDKAEALNEARERRTRSEKIEKHELFRACNTCTYQGGIYVCTSMNCVP